MHFPQGRKPLLVVALEVGVEALLGVDPQELAHDLHRQHLRIGKRGLRSASTQLLLLLHKPVIDLAENGDDEGAKIQGRRPPFASAGLVATERKEVSSFLQPFEGNLHTGLAICCSSSIT